LSTGALDDVFGISQDTEKAAPIEGSVVLSEPLGDAKDYLPMTHADGSIKLAGGRALARVKDTPAVIVNDFGAGKAALFNFAISDYVVDKLMYGSRSLIRFVDDEAAVKSAAFVRAVFERSGITPEVALSPQTPGCHLYRFERGGVQMMGLLQECAPFLPGVGAKPMPLLEEIARRTSNVTLELGEPKHVYDMLGGGYLGCLGEVTREVRPGVPQVFAVFPYKVEGILLDPARRELRQGDEISFSATVVTDGGEAGLHVLRIDLVDPDGKRARMYEMKVKAERGRYAGRIQLALNEKTGAWKMLARDVATGLTGEASFQVTAAR